MMTRWHCMAVGLVAIMVFAPELHSQPDLRFDSISVQWPDILLSFRVQCNGEQTLDLQKEQFTIYENGIPVPSFSLTCPDTLERCAVSVALVFDASGSMAGEGITGAKAAGRAFVNALEGGVDEASVIAFTTIVTTLQTMTLNLGLVRTAIGRLDAAGGTAIWDGCMRGLRMLIDDSRNPCKAIVLLTDGMDNSSTSTMADCIALANAHNIRVFSVGLGKVIDVHMLDLLASATNGGAYLVDDPRQLQAVYEAIAELVRKEARSCTLQYTGTCIDGGEREVTLIVSNVCGGSDTASKRFTAPNNTGTWTPLRLGLSRMTMPARSTARLRLSLLDTLQGNVLPPVDYSLRLDNAALTFVDVALSSPSLLTQGTPFVTLSVPGEVRFRLPARNIVSGTGPLFDISFIAADVDDTTVVSVTLERCIFDDGCFVPLLSAGSVRIVPCRWQPDIAPSGTVWICEGDTLVLKTADGYDRYRWYADSTLLPSGSSQLRVVSGGRYVVVATDVNGCEAASAPVDVFMRSLGSVSIGNQGTYVLAPGGSVTIPFLITPPVEQARITGMQRRIVWPPGITVEREDTPSSLEDTVNFIVAQTIRADAGTPDPIRLTPAVSVNGAAGCFSNITIMTPTVVIDGFCRHVVSRLNQPSLRNHPNPFSEKTDIEFILSAASHARLVVLDAFGRETAVLVDGRLDHGTHHVAFDGSGLAPGMYVAHLDAAGMIASRTMLLVR